MRCYTCAGKGAKGGCPECGKTYEEVYTTKFVARASDEAIKSGAIPDEYINIAWDTSKLLKDKPESLKSSDIFKRYVQQLEAVLQIFENGNVPNQSAIFIAPQQFAKRIFAYTCLKYAVNHGFSIAPILDNTEIKRISILSSDQYKSAYLYGKTPIESIVTADVLFMTVDVDNYGTALRTIESIMDKRSRQGKSTFVLSRFSLEAMSMFDKDKTYKGLLEKNRDANNKKFPVIIGGFISG